MSKGLFETKRGDARAPLSLQSQKTEDFDPNTVPVTHVMAFTSPPGGDLEGAFLNSALVPSVAGGKLISSAAGGISFAAPQVVAATPSNPTGTASATFVMMGLAVALPTPALGSGSGNYLLSATAALTLSVASPGTWSAELVYGTGTAPVNGVAIPGGATAVLPTISSTIGTTGGTQPMSWVAPVLGLTAGTTYWVDIAVKTTAGTATPSGITIIATQL